MLPKMTVNEKEACKERRYEITQADLPLACPGRDQMVWNAHPRVYLPIDEVGSVTCPYCGAVYVLKDFVSDEPAHKKISEHPITE